MPIYSLAGILKKRSRENDAWRMLANVNCHYHGEDSITVVVDDNAMPFDDVRKRAEAGKE